MKMRAQISLRNWNLKSKILVAREDWRVSEWTETQGRKSRLILRTGNNLARIREENKVQRGRGPTYDKNIGWNHIGL